MKWAEERRAKMRGAGNVGSEYDNVNCECDHVQHTF
jgi:hypothetical protein